MVINVSKKKEVKNEETKEVVIGEFDIDDALNEVSITSNNNQLNIEKIGKITVSVYYGEGPVPHVHLNGNNFDCCICLHDALYFSHGTNHQDIFTKQSQKNSFDLWMSKQNKKYPDKTNFKVAKDTWEDGNKKVIHIGDKPDYKKLNAQFNSNLKKENI